MNTAAEGDKLPALEMGSQNQGSGVDSVESKELAAYGTSLRLHLQQSAATFEHAVHLQDVRYSQVALTSGRDIVNVFISVAGRYL